MSETLKKVDFARLNGWKPSYVTQLAKEGRLVLTPEGRVDVAASQARIKATAAGTHQHVAERFAQSRANVPPPAADNAPPPTEPANEGGRLAVRKLREIIGREMALIELGLLKGELVKRDTVNHLWHDIGVGVRANVEAMTERLAPRISGAGSPDSLAVDIARTVRDEKRRIKRLLIDALRRMRR